MELPYIKSFRAFLQLEKAYLYSIEAYLQDLSKLLQFMKIHELNRGLSELLLKDLQDFIAYLNELGLSINSQARIVSSLKAFFRYLVIEEVIADDPALLLSAPKLARSLPSVLSYQEIEQLIAAIDHSKNKALETEPS